MIRNNGRPKIKALILGEDHSKVMACIEGQDEVFLEFIKSKTGFSIARANILMAEIAAATFKYVPEITWICTKCQEVSRIPLRDGLRISTQGNCAIKCKECDLVTSIKAFDTIVTWKLIS